MNGKNILVLLLLGLTATVSAQNDYAMKAAREMIAKQFTLDFNWDPLASGSESGSSSAPESSSSSPFSSGSSPSSESSSSEGKCEKVDYGCAKLNAKCDADVLTSDSCDEKGVTCCQFPLYCLEGVCKESSNGMNCTEDSDCIHSPLYHGTMLHQCVLDGETGVCNMRVNVGDKCKKDTDCAGSMACTDGKCAGLKLDATCEPTIEAFWGTTRHTCAEGLICAPNAEHEYACKKAVTEAGQPCGEYGCGNGLVCESDVCIKPYSLPAGSECTTFLSDGQNTCAVGTVCVADGATKGVCTNATAYKVKECKKDKDCGEDGVCDVCSVFVGKRYCQIPDTAVDCSEKWKAAVECYAKNGCAPILVTEKGTCGREKCKKETEAVFGCKSNCKANKDIMGPCVSSVITQYCKSSKSLGVIIGVCTAAAIVLVVLAVFVIARIQSRPKQENTPLLQS